MSTMTLSTISPMIALRKAGQSPWLDFISREILKNGKLKHLVRQGLLGVTSNPTIFEKAICQPKGGYETDIHKLIRQGASTFEIYDELTVSDIQAACDFFRPVFKASKGEHGFVSLEVSPALAYDTEKTIEEALRLFKKVKRPNVMIKVPATPESIPAIRELFAEGLNINITLMFSVRHYQQVIQAYIEGLEKRLAKGLSIHAIHSVASIFVSRIDTLLDKKLPQDLQGKAANANSKLIYQEFQKVLESDRFKKLQQKGATVQKVLWGSTSCKNPKYPDLIYVENLIGPETVNTMPLATLEAFLDHGSIPGNSIESNLDEARAIVDDVKRLGFDLNAVGDELQKQGAKSFCDSFDSLMKTLEQIQRSQGKGKSMKAKTTLNVDASIAGNLALKGTISALEKQNFVERFFKQDPGIWKNDPSHQKSIQNRLGWLKAADWTLGKLVEIDALCEEVRKAGIKDIVLLGMGGSSLAPEVMSLIYQKSKEKAKGPRLHILDTTDPGSILKVEKSVNLAKTLFIVASKSGGTVETISQYRYFFQQVSKKLGKSKQGEAGRSFIAITDSGSQLEKIAKDQKFRALFINPSDIGGRYSALSFFGMVPAALIGIPVRDILWNASEFYAASVSEIKIEENPSFYLGVILGQLALAGKNKLTFWMTPTLEPMGAWLEQLIAESTGKEGKGIVPIEGEAPAETKSYGKDRVFVILKLKGEKRVGLDQKVKALRSAGFPVIEVEWSDRACIGSEFLGWEIATTVAGSVMGVNPFDEPNVTESKESTGALLAQLKQTGKLPEASNLIESKAPKTKVEQGLGRLLQNPSPSYLALLSYTERTPATTKALNQLRKKLRDKFNVPVLVGFGPRYLHSIGQLYKGGFLTGSFIAFLAQDVKDAAVPEAHYRFSQLKKAQALGDLMAMQKKGLRTLAIQVGKNPVAGFSALIKKI